jgi:hypothetical protein
MGFVAAFLAAILFFVTQYPSVLRAQAINQRTLAEITCSATSCDTSAFTTDWQLLGADYAVDTRNRYLLNTQPATEENPARYAPLEFSDVGFIVRFHQAASYPTPDGEIWRLLSRKGTWNGEDVEIIVGYAQKVPWRMIDTPQSMMPRVDIGLQRDAERIADALRATSANPFLSTKGVQKLSVDAFEVVFARTGEVMNWGAWLPAYLPGDLHLPQPGRRPYLAKGEMYLVQSDSDGRVLATSLVYLGTVRGFVIVVLAAGVAIFLAVRSLSKRFLRNYFALTGVQVPELAEAIRSGEGQNIEFKRGLSDDETKIGSTENELLKSIAAFANTNDGVIYVGVDDAGNIKGIKADYMRRDRLQQKIRQLVRNQIRPFPPIQVSFDELQDFVVLKIAVARGEAPVYLLNGVIYVRDGSSDMQAQPDHFARLIARFAA